MGTPGVIVRGTTGLKRGPLGSILRFGSAGLADCCCVSNPCGPSLGIGPTADADCLDPVRPSLSSINIGIVVHASVLQRASTGATQITFQADCSINLALSFGTWNGPFNAPWSLTNASAFFFATAFYSSIYPYAGNHSLSHSYPTLAAFLAEDGLTRGIVGTPMTSFGGPGQRNASGPTNSNWRYGSENGAASDGASASCHSFAVWPKTSAEAAWFSGEAFIAGGLFILNPASAFRCGRTFDYAYPSGSTNVSGHFSHAYAGLGNFVYNQNETANYSSGLLYRQAAVTVTQTISHTACS